MKKQIEDWLLELSHNEVIPENIVALNFGIFESENGYCVYLIGSESYDVDDDDWAIQAVLYKVDTDDEVLTGFDINTSEKRVAVAALSDKTAKVDYTYFEIPFEFLKDYEEGAKYKLAIVCSSSKEGDLFKGAGGSTLILDELEVMGE